MPRKPPQAALVTREPTLTHVGFTDYIKRQTGYDADLTTVALALRLNNEYRKSDDAQKRREQERAAREAERAAVEARKREKIVAKARALQEEAAKLLAEAGLDLSTGTDDTVPVPAKARTPRKSRAAKNAEHATGVEATSEAEKRALAKAALSLVPNLDNPQTDISDAGDPDDDDTEDAGDAFVLPAAEPEPAVVPVVTGVVFDEDVDDEDDDF